VIDRLQHKAPDVMELLKRQRPDDLRRIAAHVADLAVQRTTLHDPRIESALEALRDNRPVDAAERSEVKRLAEELDLYALDLAEKAEVGLASKQDSSAAFRLARAADSVVSALKPYALIAAVDAVYEACFATDDLDAVRATVDAASGKGQ
jgi:hypothetical protein